MQLSQASDNYRKMILFRNQSSKTDENHCVALSSFLKLHGDLKISELTFEHVMKWKQCLDKSCSPATVRGYIIKLRVLLKYLRSTGIDCLDPDMIPVPKRPETVPAFLTKEQVQRLIDCTNKPKNKAIVSMLYGSGIRVSELCSLDRDSIREDGTFTVVGKGNKPRLCFTDDRTRKYLDVYKKGRADNHKALFLTEQSKRITPGTIQETFKTIRTRSGIECSPHTLRHSFATNLLRNNTNMRYVQVFLGHQSLQTTQMYAHVVDNDLRKIYQKFHTT